MMTVSAIDTKDPGASAGGLGDRREIARLLSEVSSRGGGKAASRLVQLYADRLYGLAYRILSDRQAAEDAVQDVFLALLEGRARYRGKGHPDAFLLRVASHTAIDRARKGQRQSRKEESAMALPQAHSKAELVLDAVLRKELEEEVAGLLLGLAPEARAAVALRFWGDSSIREISGILSSPRSTVHRWIEESLEKLRRPLLRKGLGAAVAATFVGDLLGKMEIPPPSSGFQASLLEAIEASPGAPAAGMPSIPDLKAPASLFVKAVVAAGAAAAFCGALFLAIYLVSRDTPPSGSTARFSGEGAAIQEIGSTPTPSGKAGPALVQEGRKGLSGGVLLEGQVLRPDGKPAQGARIRLHAGEGRYPPDAIFTTSFLGPPLAEAVPDRKGAFAFRGLPAGSYRILAFEPGSAPGTSGLLRMEKDEALRRIRIDLFPGNDIEGLCRLERGGPVEGVRIEALIAIPSGRSPQGYWREIVASDREGRFRIPGVGDPGAEISVQADRHCVLGAPQHVQKGTAQVEVILSEGLKISGTVLDPQGAPASGAEVLAFAELLSEGRSPGTGPWLLARKAVADGEGRFSLVGLAPREHVLFARKDGFAISEAKEADLTEQAPSLGAATLALQKGETIEGRFVSRGKPYGPATGAAIPMPRDGDGPQRIFLVSRHDLVTGQIGVVSFPVDPEGGFATPPLAPGDYTLAAYKEPPQLLRAGVELIAVQGSEISPPKTYLPGQRGVEVENVPDPEPFLISGKVRDEEGNGIGNCHIWCSFHFGGGYSSMNLFTDQRGVFEFESVIPAGVYESLSLSARAPGGREGELKDIPLEKERLRGLEIVIDRGAAISGTVRTAAGRPVAGAAVTLQQDGTEPWPASETRRAESDSEGRFSFAALPAGRAFRLVAEAEGFARAEIAGIEAGASGADFVLRPEAAIRGSVVDLEGNPVAPSSFWITRHEDGSARSTPVRWKSEGEGKFAILGLEPGEYTIGAHGAAEAGRQPATRESERLSLSEGETIEGIVLVMTRLVAVAGKVVDSITGAPVPGATVADWDPDSAHFPADRFRVLTDGAGRFRLDGIPRGSFPLHVAADGYLKLMKNISVSGEGDEEVLLELAPSKDLQVRVLDESGRPIEKAQVQCGFVWPARNDLFTDSEGRALVPVSAEMLGKESASKAWILVSADGHVSQRIDLSEDELRRARVEVALPQAGKVTGRVLDHEGKPVPNIQVMATKDRQGMGTWTDGKGEYVIPSLEPGAHAVGISTVEFPLPTISREISVKAGETVQVDFKIPDPATFRFHPVRIAATLEDGRLAGGAKLRPRGGKIGSGPQERDVYPLKCFLERELKTGPEGTLEILFEEPGVEQVQVLGTFNMKGEAYSPAETSVPVVNGEAAVVFKRVRQGGIVLKILDAATGSPVLDFEYSLISRNGGSSGSHSGSLGGALRLRAAPGEVTLTVKAAGYRSAERKLVLEDRGEVTLEVRLEREGE